ncbi:MAG: MerR family transcriptional regulator [Pseudohongiella sp.]|nr:MAG: MerR family transcriptional regulator [Pseudohongiella sp.]
MSKKKVYSVNDLSKLASVSIRTLHHYDEIDLLKPDRNPANGYREYSYRHLVLLQQILIYRELEFSTSNIKDLLQSKNHDLLETLRSQKELLNTRKQHFESLIEKIEESIAGLAAESNVERMYEGIPKAKAEQWETLVRDRYGQEYFEENMARLNEHDRGEVQQLRDISANIGSEMSCLLHLPVDAQEIIELAKAHAQWVVRLAAITGDHHQGSPYEMVVKFATSLGSVKELAALYDLHGEGTAEHLRHALFYYAQEELK